ncbi:MAG: hypothetical protein WAL59_26125 [Roseiarcus sp.]
MPAVMMARQFGKMRCCWRLTEHGVFRLLEYLRSIVRYFVDRLEAGHGNRSAMMTPRSCKLFQWVDDSGVSVIFRWKERFFALRCDFPPADGVLDELLDFEALSTLCFTPMAPAHSVCEPLRFVATAPNKAASRFVSTY